LFAAYLAGSLILAFSNTFEIAHSQLNPAMLPSVTSANSSIPVTDYGYVNNIYIGPQINPLEVSTTAYDNYSLYIKTHDEYAKQIFLNGANWLVKNAVSVGNYSILEYHFPWPEYNLKDPWRSGMAQALAIKTLIKAHQVTSDIRYLDAAKKLLNSFFVEVKSGGVTYKTPNDGWWYEEYAGLGGKEPRVLNGMMYSLLGIYDYYRYTNDSKAKFLFDKGISALKENLQSYDYEKYFYSYSDVFRTPSSLSSHNRSVHLLDIIYNVTKDDIFRIYHDRWQDYKIPELVDKAPLIGMNEFGIPEVTYNAVLRGESNPVTVTHFALDSYSNYLISGNETLKQIFLNAANWLVNTAVSHGNYSILAYHFPWAPYNLKPPWQSAMAQGRALQVLIRAHHITGDEKYLDTAKKLLNAFFVEVKDGGVTYKSPNDGWWYELFAGKGGKEPRVLNGMMYALLGIYDYFKYTNDSKARFLFDKGISALKENLSRYEYKGNYSNYDILGTTNPLGYHKLHIKLLGLLYDSTKDGTFESYYDMWSHYVPPAFLHGQVCRLNC